MGHQIKFNKVNLEADLDMPARAIGSQIIELPLQSRTVMGRNSEACGIPFLVARPSQDIIDVVDLGLAGIGCLTEADRHVIGRVFERLAQMEHEDGHAKAFSAAQQIAYLFANDSARN
jgi:hypothetical protein